MPPPRPIYPTHDRTPDVPRAYRFFREHTMRIGYHAVDAIALARAEARAWSLGLHFAIHDEEEPWDGETPAPPLLVWCAVYERDDHSAPLASLGMVGLMARNDPYLRVVRAELFAEALERIDERDGPAKGGPAAECAPGWQTWCPCTGTRWPRDHAIQSTRHAAAASSQACQGGPAARGGVR